MRSQPLVRGRFEVAKVCTASKVSCERAAVHRDDCAVHLALRLAGKASLAKVALASAHRVTSNVSRGCAFPIVYAAHCGSRCCCQRRLCASMRITIGKWQNCTSVSSDCHHSMRECSNVSVKQECPTGILQWIQCYTYCRWSYFKMFNHVAVFRYIFGRLSSYGIVICTLMYNIYIYIYMY